MRSAEEIDAKTGMSARQACELSVLWTKAHPIVSAYFRSAVRDFHRAEDLLQETAATVAEKFTSYDPARPFIAWVLGIARYKLLHALRTGANDRHVFDEETINRFTVTYADLAPEMHVMQAALEECIERVHGRPRKLLEMRYVRELTPVKIAALTGISAGAVSVMLHRVRRALRDCIERHLAAADRQARPSQGGA